jgi:hypothetical protein
VKYFKLREKFPALKREYAAFQNINLHLFPGLIHPSDPNFDSRSTDPIVFGFTDLLYLSGQCADPGPGI